MALLRFAIDAPGRPKRWTRSCRVPESGLAIREDSARVIAAALRHRVRPGDREDPVRQLAWTAAALRCTDRPATAAELHDADRCGHLTRS
ncbi:hypothetical protein DMP23_13110 [Amycolatopsis sp. A1MSW2902]